MPESLFNKVAGLYLKETPTKVFLVNIAMLLRTDFFVEHLWWHLPYLIKTIF